MTTYMTRSTSSLFIATIILLSNASITNAQTAEEAESLDPVMCTMDVMQCSDGSFVGRTGPQCEFICPTGDTPNETPDVRDRLGDSDIVESVDARRAQFEENQEARQELRTERRAVLSEIRQQRIINLAANISNRMDAAVERLFIIIERLESRIQKLDQRNVDTTEAKSSLQTAAQSLAEAKVQLSDIDAAVYNATMSEEAYTAWQDLRTRYQSIATLIRSTHASLRATVAALKTAVTIPSTQPEVSETTTDDQPASGADLLPTM